MSHAALCQRSTAPALCLPRAPVLPPDMRGHLHRGLEPVPHEPAVRPPLHGVQQAVGPGHPEEQHGEHRPQHNGRDAERRGAGHAAQARDGDERRLYERASTIVGACRKKDAHRCSAQIPFRSTSLTMRMMVKAASTVPRSPQTSDSRPCAPSPPTRTSPITIRAMMSLRRRRGRAGGPEGEAE